MQGHLPKRQGSEAQPRGRIRRRGAECRGLRRRKEPAPTPHALQGRRPVDRPSRRRSEGGPRRRRLTSTRTALSGEVVGKRIRRRFRRGACSRRCQRLLDDRYADKVGPGAESPGRRPVNGQLSVRRPQNQAPRLHQLRGPDEARGRAPRENRCIGAEDLPMPMEGQHRKRPPPDSRHDLQPLPAPAAKIPRTPRLGNRPACTTTRVGSRPATVSCRLAKRRVRRLGGPGAGSAVRPRGGFALDAANTVLAISLLEVGG